MSALTDRVELELEWEGRVVHAHAVAVASASSSRVSTPCLAAGSRESEPTRQPLAPQLLY